MDLPFIVYDVVSAETLGNQSGRMKEGQRKRARKLVLIVFSREDIKYIVVTDRVRNLVDNQAVSRDIGRAISTHKGV